ncbi:hypothetical protein HPB48_000696 [Haemaphysalis longicornis]|uniref:Methyltransferase type 11 domain-containing protein n=1 Tax=Haemaphysalis longicornis TaxID=44386 RepID=A0A9J6H6X3_HAELO|nr:hypothetical protein HPB48_000696 [Haemaphysalis longicornis]
MRPTSQRSALLPLLRPLWIFAFLFGSLLFQPVLRFSHKARQRFFVFFFQFVPILFVDRDNARRAALSPIGSLTSHDPQLRKRGALRLLEIGAGTGANFRYMTRPIKYTNVDPNREFESLFFSELKKHPQIELERWIEAYGEDMSELASDQFDVVLLTSTLCSVIDPGKVLTEAKRVLVKSGTGEAASRVLLATSNDLTYVQHALPPDDTNEYITVTIKSYAQKFTLIMACIPPDAAFNVDHLQHIVRSTPAPHGLTVDFNAQKPLLGLRPHYDHS